MTLRPPSQKLFAASGEVIELRQFEPTNTDLQIAQELERQILEAQIWRRVEPIVREVTNPFIDQPLSEELILRAQEALEERLEALGPDFPLPGVKLALRRDPTDPRTLLLELKDG